MTNDMIDHVRRLAPAVSVSEMDRARQRRKLNETIAARTGQSNGGGVPSRRKWHSRSRLLATGVPAVAAVVLVVGGFVVTSGSGRHLPTAPQARGVQRAPKAQLVDFTTADSEVFARITDPLAAGSELDAVFQQHGFNILVKLLPVSPSLVGSIVALSEDAGTSAIKPIQSGPCISGGQSCTVGLILPTDFQGKASVEVGRAAQAGETYASAAIPFAPGEVLHCDDIVNEQVSAAMPTLRATGQTVEWREDVPIGSATEPSPTTTTLPGSPVSAPEPTTSASGAAGMATNGEVENLTTPPPGDYVVNITTLSSSALIAWVAPQPSDAFAHAAQQANQDCSGGNAGAAGNTGTANGNTGTAVNSGAAGNTGTAAS